MKGVSKERWLSLEEIADYLGIKRDTAYKWISHKKMPAQKVGSSWKFRKGEIYRRERTVALRIKPLEGARIWLGSTASRRK